jgi:hypothetical protein
MDQRIGKCCMHGDIETVPVTVQESARLWVDVSLDRNRHLAPLLWDAPRVGTGHEK